MIPGIFFETKAVSCLLAQGDRKLPLRSLAIQIANVARLLLKSKVEGQTSNVID